MGCGGGPSSQQKSLWNAQTGLVNQETQAAKFGTNAAEATLPEATSALTGPENYFQTLLSGNKGAISSLLSPDISNIESQNQQALTAADQFTPRGGGQTAADEEARFNEAAQIGGLFNQARQTGATGVTSIAQLLSQIGLGELGGGTNAASVGGTTAANEVASMQLQQQNQQQQQASLGAGIGSLIALIA